MRTRDDYVAGMPVSWYSEVFFDMYMLTASGLHFHGWPDGGPLMRQPRKFTSLIRVARDEVEQWWKEQRKKQQRP